MQLAKPRTEPRSRQELRRPDMHETSDNACSTNRQSRGGGGDRYLALEVEAVPVGAVVEPLLLVVDEPHVARVAGRRRHPRPPPLFSLGSVPSAGRDEQHCNGALIPFPLFFFFPSSSRTRTLGVASYRLLELRPVRTRRCSWFPRNQVAHVKFVELNERWSERLASNPDLIMGLYFEILCCKNFVFGMLEFHARNFDPEIQQIREFQIL